MTQLIIALDVPSASKARELARDLKGIPPWIKVGLELFITAGPEFVGWLKTLGFKVFLDLKFYDIPNTVRGAVMAAANLGADMLTLHCLGGAGMCLAASEACAALPPDRRPSLFGVTVLTSFASGELPGTTLPAEKLALELAGIASAANLCGVVCSGHEARAIKSAWPHLACLCPGIRPEGSPGNDQRRIMTPAQAAAAGADFIVVGRPVTLASSPAKAAENIILELNETALTHDRT